MLHLYDSTVPCSGDSSSAEIACEDTNFWASGVAGSETLVYDDLPAGTYYARVQAYNGHLSHQRAVSIKQDLVWKGISKDRLELKWHGEDSLVNTCYDGSKCSADEHRLNRRAEFRILQENIAAISN